MRWYSTSPGKSPTASCVKSSSATTFSPGTKSNLLNAWKAAGALAAGVAAGCAAGAGAAAGVAAGVAAGAARRGGLLLLGLSLLFRFRLLLGLFLGLPSLPQFFLRSLGGAAQTSELRGGRCRICCASSRGAVSAPYPHEGSLSSSAWESLLSSLSLRACHRRGRVDVTLGPHAFVCQSWTKGAVALIVTSLQGLVNPAEITQLPREWQAGAARHSIARCPLAHHELPSRFACGGVPRGRCCYTARTSSCRSRRSNPTAMAYSIAPGFPD